MILIIQSFCMSLLQRNYFYAREIYFITRQIRNSKVSDSGGKLIFENATLCSQFLREYSGIEMLKNVRAEDIEDMTERFIPMFTEERESDYC